MLISKDSPVDGNAKAFRRSWFGLNSVHHAKNCHREFLPEIQD
jgi:hypothetical protein